MCDVAAARRWLGAVRPDPGRAPDWMVPLLRGLEHAGPRDISTNDLPADHVGPRQSAVLVLLGQGPDGPEVVLQRRARRLRHHSGEISFPGAARTRATPIPRPPRCGRRPRRPGWTRSVWTSSRRCRA
ncbi:hypothetical protein [Pseudonocardia sp. HH130629-09]|uniref:hypothetical protein n=1 Tax=Pseudonocardia sp. HH130629-09 TaxID=1641402 RepID=UPI000761FE21|nr:hypothetical protein [Pseudonocardia sp. HH130629-09]